MTAEADQGLTSQ